LGPIPNPQSPIPNPPIPNPLFNLFIFNRTINLKLNSNLIY